MCNENLYARNSLVSDKWRNIFINFFPLVSGVGTLLIRPRLMTKAVIKIRIKRMHRISDIRCGRKMAKFSSIFTALYIAISVTCVKGIYVSEKSSIRRLLFYFSRKPFVKVNWIVYRSKEAKKLNCREDVETRREKIYTRCRRKQKIFK